VRPRDSGNLSSRDAAKASAVAERRAECIELLLQGYRPTDVATMLGYSSVARVSEDVQASLMANRQVLAARVDELRGIEMMRLLEIIKVNWPAMKNGSTRAGEVILKADSAIRELMGLNAPQRYELSMAAVEAEIADLEEQIRGQGGGVIAGQLALGAAEETSEPEG
jgi:hypothetical protein